MVGGPKVVGCNTEVVQGEDRESSDVLSYIPLQSCKEHLFESKLLASLGKTSTDETFFDPVIEVLWGFFQALNFIMKACHDHFVLGITLIFFLEPLDSGIEFEDMICMLGCIIGIIILDVGSDSKVV